MVSRSFCNPLKSTGLLGKTETTKDVNSYKRDDKCHRSPNQTMGRNASCKAMTSVSSSSYLWGHEHYFLWFSLQLDWPPSDLPSKAFTKKIIHLYPGPIIPEITQIILLSNTDFIVFKECRSHKEGMTYDETVTYLWQLVERNEWVGQPIIIQSMLLTLKETSVQIGDSHDFIHQLAQSEVDSMREAD